MKISATQDAPRSSPGMPGRSPISVRRSLTAYVKSLPCVATHLTWHNCGMTRIRLSTTVDAELLESARTASGKSPSALVDEALEALLARYRSAEVDASYAAYDRQPLDEPDEWGDLASFRRAAAAS